MPITKEDGVIVGLVFLSLFALIVGIGLCICFCGGKGVLNRCVPNQFRLDADATDSALPDGRGRTVMVGGGVEVGDFTGKAGVGAGGGDNMDEWVRYVTVKEMYEKSSEGSMSPQALKQWLAGGGGLLTICACSVIASGCTKRPQTKQARVTRG